MLERAIQLTTALLVSAIFAAALLSHNWQENGIIHIQGAQNVH
jgi:hypothetical protein